VNLAYRREVRLAVVSALKAGVIAASLLFLILGSVAAPTFTPASAAPAATEEERKALEAELKALEAQIDRYEDQIIGYQKQGNTLKNEIAALNSKIAKLNLQIKAINLTLRELDAKIGETEAKIRSTEASIEDKREALARLVKDLYENDKSSLMEIFLRNPRLSDFFSDVNSLTLLQNNLRLTIAEITDLREELVDQKEQYGLARADAATLRNYQESQKAEADAVKKQKDQLLAVTKGQESKYQELLNTTRKTAAQIRSRIFQLLGGGEMSFEDAYKLAKLAESATGIRAAFLLAVLDRESALGQNVGRCKYNEINPRTGRQTMHPVRDVPIFLEITRALNIDPESVTVSCANADGAYGGAMGPAQFIPSTWNLYDEKISEITGHSPASPWSNADAFVATALYIRDALQGCKSAYSNALSQERCAAAKYYAGGRWQSYLWTYGEAVISRARRFEEDIAAITS
jgi:peptidoglycan hydrolase CwlO-like protein